MKAELTALVFHPSCTQTGAGQAAVPATVTICRSGSFVPEVTCSQQPQSVGQSSRVRIHSTGEEH